MKPSAWAQLVNRYRAALATYAGASEETHLQAAYELGREALNAGLGVLDMVRLHHEAAEPPAGSAATPQQGGVAQGFLMEALSPFEAAHRAFRDACDRLRCLNETLKERNELLASTNLRLESEIVARTRAQQGTEESEQKFRSVVESARDGIVTTDGAGRIVALNRGAEVMFGYKRSELLGKTFARLLPVERRGLARFQLRRLLSGNAHRLVRKPFETAGLHRDGVEFPVELCVSTWRTREGTFFTGIVRDIRERKQAETALRESREHYMRLFQESRAMQENLRQLSNKVLTAQEEERQHISRELHDEIGQTLTAANVSVALLRKHAQADPEFARKVESAQRLLEQSMEMVHQFARELRPSMLDHLGPFAAMQNYVKTYTERTGIAVDLESNAGFDDIDVQRGTVLYRVTQECLTNVFKHAHATRVKVRLSREPGAVCLEVSDNGRGTAAPLLGATNGRQQLGLMGMQERVRLVDGQFSIESMPKRGTTVRVRIPLSPELPMGGGSPSHLTTDTNRLTHHTSHEQNQCAACR